MNKEYENLKYVKRARILTFILSLPLIAVGIYLGISFGSSSVIFKVTVFAMAIFLVGVALYVLHVLEKGSDTALGKIMINFHNSIWSDDKI